MSGSSTHRWCKEQLCLHQEIWYIYIWCNIYQNPNDEESL